MTLDELRAREAIRDLMARYTIAGDRLQAEALAAVFTPDGILESDGVPAEEAFRYEGREEISAWLSRWGRADGRPHRATFVRHHLSTSLVEMTGPGTARGRTYWVAWTDIGADHGGVYIDGYADRGEGWRIAHRRVRLDWRSPDSLFGGAIAHTH